jgi:serine/threonine protein kinase
VKVIDLGSARLSGQENHSPRALMGTLAYMAPELLDHALSADEPDRATGSYAKHARALRRTGERSDVYALGLVLRELLFGAERDELVGEGWLPFALDRATQPLLAPSTVLHARVAQARRDSRPVMLARGVVDRTLARRLTHGLEAVMQQATELDPHRRTSSAAALAASLEHDVERTVRAGARRRRAAELCASAVAGGLAGWLLG